MDTIGKGLILLGGLLVIAGGAIWLIDKAPWIGRLPGDIVIQRDNFSCLFPLATSILLSLVLTVLLNLVLRVLNR